MDGLISKFERMGARVKVGVARREGGPVRIDIGHDERGEFFDVRVNRAVDVEVIDVQPRDRHLLLLARDHREKNEAKAKFLCGHDERHWFVAAVPEVQGVSNVATAMDALKPPEVWRAIERTGLAKHRRNARRNAAFVRQGEWFFIPAPNLRTEKMAVLTHEPIARGGGKPHFCQYLVRQGGQRVYVSTMAPNGLVESKYRALDVKKRGSVRWRVMQRDAVVYVRGYVRHSDHATIWLKGWHRVAMNTETQSLAMRHVAFLD